MKGQIRTLALAAATLSLGAARLPAQEVHEIRMEARGPREFRFDPASIEARRGDVLLFRAMSGSPHSVVFERQGLSAEAREKLNAALPRRAGDLSSPLLTDGTEYRVVIPALPSGRYRFFCLPHRAYDMRGEFTVK